jgi:hypothetical protein
MRPDRPRRLGPRVVVVVALAFAAGFLGHYLVHLGDSGEYGWFAYAPLNSQASIAHTGFEPWQKLLIWLGLIAVWALVSVWVLRSREPRGSNDQ